jgi:hypothetical protein
MSTITVKDRTTIYNKDWGKGPVVTYLRTCKEFKCSLKLG